MVNACFFYAQVLPIDDVIMPRIESGRWTPFPYRSSSSRGVASTANTASARTGTGAVGAAAATSVGGTADAAADNTIYASAGTSRSSTVGHGSFDSGKSESFQKRYDAAFMHQLPQVS